MVGQFQICNYRTLFPLEWNGDVRWVRTTLCLQFRLIGEDNRGMLDTPAP
ncbi:hypothetical protein Fmac_019323 [Flemingia macrophylla]|uniref:Uncharacterized protein n=1 Tax=Flemingia macrophylla TaxID=520843 RepID=A0ABD1M7X2_9FABA